MLGRIAGASSCNPEGRHGKNLSGIPKPIASDAMRSVVLAAAQGGEGDCEAGGAHHGKGAYAGLQVGQVQHGHALQDAQRVRHEPEQPHHDAERVETLLGALAAPNVGDGCPGGVRGHEHDGEHAGSGVHSQGGIAAVLRHERHDGGARRVEGEARPEQNEVALRERVPTLVEHPDGVEHEREANGGRRQYQLNGHGRSLPFVGQALGEQALS